ncbi:hypothetical protein [Perlabentimonas gracilis]|uniref:hypothetical protein n=1 Tax=Perlabentimonas gracilis TaxID=2715279 RepID=UPI0014096667|nr:hypothetical protein [Perlabentimonas gracilis]NHB69397.1 hypothetical protein [Perlabentimonas gracilis]
MPTFYCKTCDLKFEAEGTKQEWIDPTFGPCSKLTAPCPTNGEECSEYQPPKQSKEAAMPSAPACGMQGGCCGCGG